MKSIKILILLLPITLLSQSAEPIVDKVSYEICTELNKIEGSKNLTQTDIKVIMGNVLLANKTKWENDLDKIEIVKLKTKRSVLINTIQYYS